MSIPLALKLSSEQKLFIEKALQGKNILVDACIGSGLYGCDEFMKRNIMEYER